MNQTEGQTISYTRETLVALRKRAAAPPKDLPAEIKARKRGTRAGAIVKERKRNNDKKTYLPSVVMGNVRSLANKTDELAALVKNQAEYKDSSLLCFTESWLHDNIPDCAVEQDGFTMVRADRNKDSGKRKGGGGGIVVAG